MFWLKMLGEFGLKKGRDEDAGYDIFSSSSGHILPFTSKIIETNIKTAFAEGYVGMIFDRGSTGLKGLMRQAGVVDSGYRDFWQVKLYNTSHEVWSYSPDKAIAQVVFMNYEKIEIEICTELPTSLRMEGKFGSTDKSKG